MGEGEMSDERPSLTHIDSKGRLRMVDVTDKEATLREARAEARVRVSPETARRISDQTLPKGNVFEAARLAGIMAAKKTSDLIPLCHPIQLTGINVDFAMEEETNEIRIFSRVKTTDKTGVEMEALVAASVAALTIYDMCKAIDRGMTIMEVRMTYKSGGKSGVFQRNCD